MKFGLFAINMGLCSDPVTAVRIAQAPEAAGFESVWASGRGTTSSCGTRPISEGPVMDDGLR